MYLADLCNPKALRSSFRDTPFYVVTHWPGHDFADASEAEVLKTIIDPIDQKETTSVPGREPLYTTMVVHRSHGYISISANTDYQ